VSQHIKILFDDKLSNQREKKKKGKERERMATRSLGAFKRVGEGEGGTQSVPEKGKKNRGMNGGQQVGSLRGPAGQKAHQKGLPTEEGERREGELLYKRAMWATRVFQTSNYYQENGGEEVERNFARRLGKGTQTILPIGCFHV